MGQGAHSLYQIGRKHRGGGNWVNLLLELQVADIVNTRGCDSLVSNLRDKDIVSTTDGFLTFHIVHITDFANQRREFGVGSLLSNLTHTDKCLVNDFARLLGMLLQTGALLLQSIATLLQSLVDLLALLLLLFHLVESQQCLLITLAYTIEVLLQCTIVIKQFLLLIHTLLVVLQQLLLLCSLLLAGLQLEIICDAQHNSYGKRDKKCV